MEKEVEDYDEDTSMDQLYHPFSYKSFIERYYHKYYMTPSKDDAILETKDKTLLSEGHNLDQYIFMHSNKYFL